MKFSSARASVQKESAIEAKLVEITTSDNSKKKKLNIKKDVSQEYREGRNVF
jgi:hypothetical protein